MLYIVLGIIFVPSNHLFYTNLLTWEEGEVWAPPTILLLTMATMPMVMRTRTNEMRMRAPRIGISLRGFLDSSSGLVASCFSPDLGEFYRRNLGRKRPGGESLKLDWFWETSLRDGIDVDKEVWRWRQVLQVYFRHRGCDVSDLPLSVSVSNFELIWHTMTFGGYFWPAKRYFKMYWLVWL